MMKFTTKEYDSAKHILAIPDHYVAIARTAAKATAAGGMVVSATAKPGLPQITVIAAITDSEEGE